MKKLLLFLILTFTTLNVHAKWFLVGSGENLVSYVDTESYKQTGQEKTYEDVLPSIFKSPTDLSNTKDLRRDMESMIQSNLNDVERDVLRLRLGLDDGRVKPVKEIGRIFHISWKQVRSLEKQALSKLLDSNEIGEFCDKMMDV